VISLSTPFHLHPPFAYGGLSAIKVFFPTSDIDSGPNTFRPEALVQHISTAGYRERYAPRHFVIGVESYTLCGKRHITVEYCEYASLFLLPFVEGVRLWTFIMGVLGPFGRSFVVTCYTMRMSDVRFTDLSDPIRKEPPGCHRTTSIFAWIVDSSPFSRFKLESALSSGEVRLIELRSWRC